VFYEDVKVQPQETVSGLAVDYGYRADEWRKIWDDPKNRAIATSRGRPEGLRVGDVIFVPISWVVSTKHLTVEANGVGFTVQRSGGKGTRLSWVQTVYQDNQPAPSTTVFCVDGCPADDDLPFYWTEAELAVDPTRRKTFIDHPQRPAPSAAAGTTRWRAIVSIAVVTDKRVTVYDSTVWGFDRKPDGTITQVGPRTATAAEIAGHLNLLRNGKGTGAGTFGSQGWTFRSPMGTP
jgi:hypothetical protein